MPLADLDAEIVTLYMDGYPLRTTRFGNMAVALKCMKRLSDKWYLVRGEAQGVPNGVYHLHGKDFQGTFKGSWICMECREEFPEALRPIVQLQQGVRW